MSINTIDSEREILFESLSVGDKLLLQTKNNSYQFIITNVAGKLGFLSGGSFGDISVIAFLCQPVELKTGSRLRFCLENVTECVFIRTSSITHLEVFRRSEMNIKTSAPTIKLPSQLVSYAY